MFAATEAQWIALCLFGFDFHTEVYFGTVSFGCNHNGSVSYSEYVKTGGGEGRWGGGGIRTRLRAS